MIKGIGVDCVSIDHVERCLAKHGFAQRVYTAAELTYIEQKRSAGLQSAAGIFAAKEAVAKALGTGIGSGTSLREIEVTHTAQGAPQIALLGDTLFNSQKLGANCIHISITHQGDTAIAFCVLEGEKEGA